MSSYGWNIKSDKVDEALDEYVEQVGYEYAFRAITQALSRDELKENLEYIFRMEDFDSTYLEEDSEDEEEDEDGVQDL